MRLNFDTEDSKQQTTPLTPHYLKSKLFLKPTPLKP